MIYFAGPFPQKEGPGQGPPGYGSEGNGQKGNLCNCQQGIMPI